MRRISKVRRKPLNPNDRNNGPWACKIVKRPQRKQVGPRELKERSTHENYEKWKASKNRPKEPKVKN